MEGKRALDTPTHTAVSDVGLTSAERNLAFGLLWTESHSRLRIIGRKTSSRKAPHINGGSKSQFSQDFSTPSNAEIVQSFAAVLTALDSLIGLTPSLHSI